MVNDEIGATKFCQCCFYFRNSGVYIRFPLGGIGKVDITMCWIYLRQRGRNDVEPDFSVIGVQPAVWVNVFCGVFIFVMPVFVILVLVMPVLVFLVLVMPVFVKAVFVTVGFEGRTFTEGKHFGTLSIHEFDDFGVYGQCIQSVLEPGCQVMADPEDEIGCFQRCCVGWA